MVFSALTMAIVHTVRGSTVRRRTVTLHACIRNSMLANVLLLFDEKKAARVCNPGARHAGDAGHAGDSFSGPRDVERGAIQPSGSVREQGPRERIRTIVDEIADPKKRHHKPYVRV